MWVPNVYRARNDATKLGRSTCDVVHNFVDLGELVCSSKFTILAAVTESNDKFIGDPCY